MTRAGAAVALGAAGLLVAGALRSPQQTPPATTQDTSRYEAPVDVDTAGLPGPRQPIFFRHDIHAGQYKMDCKYCHAYVERAWNPGIPSTASCMGCHLIVGSGNPEVQKLRDAVAANQPVEWVEIHRVSPFVRFPHMRHVVNGELECKECHGEVERMPQVYQYASLKMGWCVGCHMDKEYKDQPGRGVTTDCSACHY
jgi:Cytochrome c7 and related cytochrome c